MHFEDLIILSFVVFLEGVLSVDNAVVLAVLVRKIPVEQQRKALTYGLAGAIVMRLVILVFLKQVFQYEWIKWIGAGYLLFVSIRGLTKKEISHKTASDKEKLNFWKVVVLIELTDLAFALDSILAAMALSSKLWIVFAGGIIGVVIMRFFAMGFTKLIHRFPKLETSAFVMVGLVGAKMLIVSAKIEGLNLESSKHVGFWIFWLCMFASVALAFVKRNAKAAILVPSKSEFERPEAESSELDGHKLEERELEKRE